MKRQRLQAYLTWAPATCGILGAQVSHDHGMTWFHTRVKESDLIHRHGKRWRLVQFPNGSYKDAYGWVITTPDDRLRVRLVDRPRTLMTFELVSF